MNERAVVLLGYGTINWEDLIMFVYHYSQSSGSRFISTGLTFV